MSGLDTQTHTHTHTLHVTLAAHARRGLVSLATWVSHIDVVSLLYLLQASQFCCRASSSSWALCRWVLARKCGGHEALRSKRWLLSVTHARSKRWKVKCTRCNHERSIRKECGFLCIQNGRLPCARKYGNTIATVSSKRSGYTKNAKFKHWRTRYWDRQYAYFVA